MLGKTLSMELDFSKIRSRRVRILTVIALLCVAFCWCIGEFELRHYEHDYSRTPDSTRGFVVPDNDHGTIIYITRKREIWNDITMWLMPPAMIFLLFVTFKSNYSEE